MKNNHFALWALALSTFAIGVTEFAPMALLSVMSKDLAIPLETASWAVSIYALGVAIGAPLLTAMSQNMERKKLVLWVLLLFVLGNALAGFSWDFASLLFARLITGFAHGVFLAIGAPIAMACVAENKKGSAVATLFSGLTIAIIVGVPLSTFLGQNMGWRYAFLLIAFLGTLSYVATLLLLPKIQVGISTSVRTQFQTLKEKPIILGYTLSILGFGSSFVFFPFLAHWLGSSTNISVEYLSICTFLYGTGIALGNYFGGKLSNKNPLRTVFLVCLWQMLCMVALYVFATQAVLVYILLFCLGVGCFAIVPATQFYIIHLATQKKSKQHKHSLCLQYFCF